MIASSTLPVNGHAGQLASNGCGSLVSIGKLAARLGISQSTIRKASNEGELKTYALPGSNHRRYLIDDALRWLGHDVKKEDEGKARTVVIYARVSSQGQAKGFSKGNEDNDLARQLETLLAFARTEYGCADPIVLRDVGSGISFGESARPAFNKLIDMMLSGAIDNGIVLCNYKDRLARFAVEIIEKIAKHHGVTIVYASDTPDKSSEEELTADLIAFTHIYSCRFYSKRSSEKRRVQPLPQVVKRILELHQLGCSQKTLVDRLAAEGLGRDSQGRNISRTVVARILKESEGIKTQLVGPKQTNSFGRFAEAHLRIQKVDPAQLGKRNKTAHVGHKSVMTHFKAYCASHNEATISNRRVSSYLIETLGVQAAFNWKGNRIYYGLSFIGLDGEGRHNIKSANYDHGND